MNIALDVGLHSADHALARRQRADRRHDHEIPPTYFLTGHTHVCVTDGNTILLDVKQDRYVGLGPMESRALAAALEGWASIESGDTRSMPQTGALDAESSPANVQALIADLLDRNLLTTDSRIGKPVEPLALTPARRSAPFRPRSSPRLGHVLRFLAAVFTTFRVFRFRSFDYAVRVVEARKQTRAFKGDNSVESVGELAAVFAAMRPFLFTARDACLFDSFALVEFLSRCGVFPTWVIGVRAGPFAAHSWVQYEDLVLNDTPAAVLQYTPILAV